MQMWREFDRDSFGRGSLDSQAGVDRLGPAPKEQCDGRVGVFGFRIECIFFRRGAVPFFCSFSTLLNSVWMAFRSAVSGNQDAPASSFHGNRENRIARHISSVCLRGISAYRRFPRSAGRQLKSDLLVIGDSNHANSTSFFRGSLHGKQRKSFALRHDYTSAEYFSSSEAICLNF